HDDVTQMTRNGSVAVLPDQIRGHPAFTLAPAAQHQDGARTGQLVGLADEIVLPAYTAEHAAAFQLIRHAGTQQSGREHGIDEARIAALLALQRFTAVELIDDTHAGHVDAIPLRLRQFAQTAVEIA